jgi:hypothetical protein
LHPNLNKGDKDEKGEGEDEEEKEKNKFVKWCEGLDTKYIRPFLIYKYKKLKGRVEFEFEDVLREYQMIEDELNVDTDEDEDLQGLPEDYRNLSNNLAKRKMSNAS